jgi:hypothetical protein
VSASDRHDRILALQERTIAWTLSDDTRVAAGDNIALCWRARTDEMPEIDRLRSCEPGRALTDATMGATAAIRRAYDLQGCVLGISSDDAEIAAFLEPVLAPLACMPTRCDWIASLRSVEAIDYPNNGRRIFEGTLPEGLTAIMVEHEGARRLVVPDHFAMHFLRPQRTTDIHYVPGRASALDGTVAFWMLDDVLAAHAQHLLHGASIVDPKSDEAILIFAPSGTGKTTTALALARSGCHFDGDDAVALSSDTAGCCSWAIPRRIKIDRRTAEMLPWLAPCLSDVWTDGEQAFARDGLSSLVTLSRPQLRRVRLVIVLTPPNDAAHVATPISKPEALAAIATDNLRVTPSGVDPDKTAALSALTQLVANTPVVALSVGPDLSSLSAGMICLDGRA